MVRFLIARLPVISPVVFGTTQVITGWTEGLQLMKEGAKYRFFIPAELAYGQIGSGM